MPFQRLSRNFSSYFHCVKKMLIFDSEDTGANERKSKKNRAFPKIN